MVASKRRYPGVLVKGSKPHNEFMSASNSAPPAPSPSLLDAAINASCSNHEQLCTIAQRTENLADRLLGTMPESEPKAVGCSASDESLIGKLSNSHERTAAVLNRISQTLDRLERL